MVIHLSVMKDEVVKFLNINPFGVYIDATFGLGGHASAILNKLSRNGVILVVDKDLFSIRIARCLASLDFRIKFFHGSFENLEYALSINDIIPGCVDGIVVDLGVSNFQLVDKNRGFSYSRVENLDMRMDVTKDLAAKDFLNNVSFKSIYFMLSYFFDLHFSKKLAIEIIAYRNVKSIDSTLDLVNIFSKCESNFNLKNSSLSKFFYSIRALVNNEIPVLQEFLVNSLKLLKVNGRLVLISFNSLEDKIIKDFISKYKFDSKSKHIENSAYLKIICKVRPSVYELNNNICSRSAIMRVIERVQ